MYRLLLIMVCFWRKYVIFICYIYYEENFYRNFEQRNEYENIFEIMFFFKKKEENFFVIF